MTTSKTGFKMIKSCLCCMLKEARVSLVSHYTSDDMFRQVRSGLPSVCSNNPAVADVPVQGIKSLFCLIWFARDDSYPGMHGLVCLHSLYHRSKRSKTTGTRSRFNTTTFSDILTLDTRSSPFNSTARERYDGVCFMSSKSYLCSALGTYRNPDCIMNWVSFFSPYVHLLSHCTQVQRRQLSMTCFYYESSVV